MIDLAAYDLRPLSARLRPRETGARESPEGPRVIPILAFRVAESSRRTSFAFANRCHLCERSAPTRSRQHLLLRRLFFASRSFLRPELAPEHGGSRRPRRNTRTLHRP